MKVAICIGINQYDPAVYGSGSNLHQCVRDAQAMRTLLESKGFKVSLLLDEQATRAKLIYDLQVFATLLQAGDTLVVAQSSHGTYMDLPLLNRATGLCMHDGVLWDWQQVPVWKQFKQGVKITRMIDCCFSESNFRAVLGAGIKARYVPAPKSSYALKPSSASMKGVKASIVSISSSSITQVSYENNQGGIFTQALESETQANPEFTYRQIRDAIAAKMKAGGWAQTPKLEVVNAATRARVGKFGE